MNDSIVGEQPGGRLTRRALLAAGGVGVAGLWLGPEWTVVDGVAEAATRQPELRRSGWFQVTEPALRARIDGRGVGLRLRDVSDLPIAAQLPALRDHDAAFAVRLVGPPGLGHGIWTIEHAELGAFSLFVAPVERVGGDQQLYEAIVDRTVRIVGVTDDPVPAPEALAIAEARATVPAVAAVAVPTATAAGPARMARPSRPGRPARRATRSRPRIRRLAVARSRSRRVVVAETTFENARTVVAVHALLMARGRVVARAGGPVRRASRVRLRLKGRRGVPGGRYELRLTVVERSGRVTRLRRTVRVR
ncbi:MAG: hypothetical protein ITG02_06125 [Patulibacter sp.]|nr:hypothetical protein [Patulibacter sp.]